MRPGIQCVLEILRGERPARVIDGAEWEAALALAEEEHILPWLASRLRALSSPIPPAIEARIAQIERDAAIAAFYWGSELQNVLAAFHRHGIRAVPLKGPFLAERLYGSASLRACRDLDLLVSESDLSRAEAVLSTIGFAPGAPDDYHRPWRRRTTAVELHHDVENPLAFNFHVEGALRRAQPASFREQPCFQLTPEDELLFLCLHAARHRFERLSLLLDLQFAFDKLPATTAEWNPRPEVAPLDCLLALGLAMVRRLQPNAPSHREFLGAEDQTQHLEQLADRLWGQLLALPSQPLDWRQAHTFFLELERPGWPRLRRRCRHLRILAGRVIETDYTFAARFGLHHTWQARLLRPIRLISGSLSRQSYP